MRELDLATSTARRRAHEERVDALLAPWLDRRARGEKHAVDDFMLTYYSLRPNALRRWHPGVGAAVVGSGATAFAGWRGYRVEPGRASVDPAWIAAHRDTVGWIAALLAATARRPPALGCFGLHEWAMVYRQRPHELRHPAHPLRLGSDGTNAVVEANRLACTHFDAFRFFTDPARERATLRPTRDQWSSTSQAACTPRWTSTNGRTSCRR